MRVSESPSTQPESTHLADRPVLVAATTNLGFKVGWSLVRIGLILLGSCIPFVAFVLERRVAAEIEPLTLDRVAA